MSDISLDDDTTAVWIPKLNDKAFRNNGVLIKKIFDFSIERHNYDTGAKNERLKELILGWGYGVR